jgi:hypothetical protein
MYITNLFEGCVVLFVLFLSEGVVFVVYGMGFTIQRRESKTRRVFFVT